ncbi:MAG: hypothetical protein COS84_05610 [Armatimonadetes bacterium CG07_land_8_20_14_0_80_40_9]|nr:MAG: hypothetical protein COS84_05610 [Armatimonadetes bacterium CG07_land_8_20_14_0_80_40_9]
MIAFVSTYLPQECGIATYTDYLIRGIFEVDKDVEVSVVCERAAGRYEKERFKSIPCFDRKEDYVEDIVKGAKGADVVHLQHEYSIFRFDDRFSRVLKGLSSSQKKVVTLHCVHTHETCNRGASYGLSLDIEKYNREIVELSDQVIVHIRQCRDLLIREGAEADKISLIAHGTEITDVDQISSRQRLGLPQEGKIILMFGFIKPFKCIHIVLDALKEVLNEVGDAYFFVAGGIHPYSGKKKEKEYLELCQKKIKELGIEKRVIFPNKFFSNEDVPYIFSSSDVVLFPYYEDNRSASGAFHLAVGAGKPVIASRIPKFEELAEVSEDLIVLPHNSQAIASRIIRLFQDEEFHQSIMEKVEEFRQRTSWQEVAREHLSLYRMLGVR